MPFRSTKMNRFIFGFQRRVWCPKWTPASSRSFMVMLGTSYLPGLWSSTQPLSWTHLSAREPPASGARVCGLGVLALAELEALAGARLSVLLAFLHARVTGQHALAPQDRPQRRIVGGQGAGDRQTQRVRLPRLAPAHDARGH